MTPKADRPVGSGHMGASGRIAVVLFNLGGPDRLEAVRPFLRNLFADPAIIRVPQPLRWLLAELISRRRAPVARAIYGRIGGGSPLLAETAVQARALETVLRARGRDARCFIAMRYWHPRAAVTVAAVKAFAPDSMVLLPLYPHFSTTTSQSSLDEWRRAAAKARLTAPSRWVCCYPTAAGFVEALTELVQKGMAAARATQPVAPRVLFSAHGLPKRIVEAGDPYPWQIEQTAAACIARLAAGGITPVDHVVCYQSRVGPLAWIGPPIEDELARAAADRVPVVVVPIAFVSEHSETLVELDMDYRERAAALGVPGYHRVPTVGTHPAFISGLAELVESTLSVKSDSVPAVGRRLCPRAFGRCPCPDPRAGPVSAMAIS
ncbi:MAG: ferrochelatase [Rhodospirillales bacterium]